MVAPVLLTSRQSVERSSHIAAGRSSLKGSSEIRSGVSNPNAIISSRPMLQLGTVAMTQRAPLASAVDAFKSNNFNVKNLLDLQENSADGYKTAYRIIDAATAAAAHMDLPGGPSPNLGDRRDFHRGLKGLSLPVEFGTASDSPTTNFDAQNPYSRWFQTTGSLPYPGKNR